MKFSFDSLDQIVQKLTFDEKAALTEAADDVYTAGLPEYGIPAKAMVDGPHGLRLDREKNCTLFPNLCLLASTWDPEIGELMGDALANECIEHHVDLMYAPGINIKRTPFCGRNFEYFSEDPLVAGEMSAAYINGMQKKGVGACLKHYACNNQERYRGVTSAEIDERTLRELYLKGFEIAVKKSKPTAIMCAYNKVNAIWCSENKFLLTDVLRKEWGYDGFVVSDYGAVHDPVRALSAGLDFRLPANGDPVPVLKAGIEKGTITEEQLDAAAKNVLKFLVQTQPEPRSYDRAAQHETAKKIAEAGIVLLKNEHQVLPLTAQKYKKIAVIGEAAVNPLICGQGSAEVYPAPEFIDCPLDQLKKLLPEVEFTYRPMFQKGQYSEKMLWPELYKPGYQEFVEDADAFIIFAGAMVSEDTEMMDRRSIEMNSNYDMYIEFTAEHNKNVIVVLQNGSAIVPGSWHSAVPAVVEMWLGGESAGTAIAEVLCGKVNPSGKLPETFPLKRREDLEYPGDGHKVVYAERLAVGYRYYDQHPEDIWYPFGHGLSYTEFSYSNLNIQEKDGSWEVSFQLKNSGTCAGAEVVQLYVSDKVSTVTRPLKELKKFVKIHLNPGEEREIHFTLGEEDFAYYNIMLHEWVAENGWYQILIGSSSRDIRLTADLNYDREMPYTTMRTGHEMMGDTVRCFQ